MNHILLPLLKVSDSFQLSSDHCNQWDCVCSKVTEERMVENDLVSLCAE